MRAFVYLFTEVVAAEREAAHKRCQDSACREDGAAEDERELPHPDDLINEAAGTGKDKDEPNDGFNVSHFICLNVTMGVGFMMHLQITVLGSVVVTLGHSLSQI